MFRRRVHAATSIGVALCALAVLPQDGLAKSCPSISAGGSGAQRLELTAKSVTCSTATAIAKDFWFKRGRKKHGGPTNAQTYYTLRKFKGWRCGYGLGGGACSRGAKRVSYQVIDAPPAPVVDDRPAVGGRVATGAAETAALFDGIPQRGFELGNADAPMTIVEFMDLQCPFCAQYELADQPTVLRELVRTGLAKLRMAPIALAFMGEDSEAARTVAARLAARNRAWDFVDLFARNQGQEQTGYVTDDFLLGLAAAIPGATMSDAARVPDATTKERVREADRLVGQLDVVGVPSFAVGPSGQAARTYRLVEPKGKQTWPQALAAAVASGS